MARILDLVIVAATATLALRLFTLGLASRYRAFFAYIIFATLRSAAIHSVNPTSGAYEKIWVLTEPIEWAFFALVVLELYSLVLQDYKGIASFGRWALMIAVGVAVLVSALSLLAPSQASPQGRLLTFYYIADRAVYFSLMAFLLTILAVLLQYPLQLSRNIVVHSLVFSVYFPSYAIVYLLLSTRAYQPGALEIIGSAVDLVTLAAILTWLLMLNRAGEATKVVLRPSFMPGSDQDLVNQLNHLNAALLRVGRK